MSDVVRSRDIINILIKYPNAKVYVVAKHGWVIQASVNYSITSELGELPYNTEDVGWEWEDDGGQYLPHQVTAILIGD